MSGIKLGRGMRGRLREVRDPERNLPPGSGLAIAMMLAFVFWAVVAFGLSYGVLSRDAAPETPPSTQD
ncbi:hypothetical protein [Roseovarius sp. BRH_c41]|uniref:hypothetical protein n=1 Tax=Roseovarius sp. BRH_c41 TaxID=1629709 RepID=UPI0005F0DB5C|nr:hypothetical protein [Roseovarius sp. BRH_c41]KJS43520.1 MAG: hypothetical protein VR71_10000 [Roseovarius sp. BRH_c41]